MRSLYYEQFTQFVLYMPHRYWRICRDGYVVVRADDLLKRRCGAAAAGATALINSIANLGGYLGPFMLGVIKQNTGSTDLGYFALGGMLVISGLVMLTLPKKTAVEIGQEK